MSKKVTKAVIAAAGFGTRFLPATKAVPKEMLPIVDKPIIQYVVEELVDAGIKDIIVVVGSTKRTLEDHFDLPSRSLVDNIKNGGAAKAHLLEEVEKVATLANFIYVRQKGRYGNGTPLLNAACMIGEDEPFIYTFADDFITASPTRFRQMVDVYDKYNSPVISCIPAQKDEDYNRYGFISGKKIDDHLLRMDKIIEKPGKDKAPSNLASVSSYLLTGNIFPYLEKELSNIKDTGEFCLQPAMQSMINDGRPVYGLEIQNAVYNDSGGKLDYIKTVIDFALRRDDIKDELREFLISKIGESKNSKK